jgi:hypothetical protein
VDRQVRASALVRATLSLGDAVLRARYVTCVAQAAPIAALAQTLDTICERAEQAETASRETLIAIVDALNGDGMEDLIQRLREEAASDSLLALERLIRIPPRSRTSSTPPRDPRAPDGREGRGRPVPLGERKSLARRPDRETLQRMLRDPHPDVIRRCMSNPRLVEDDVVRLAARRPGHADALAEIARTRWVHRPRVRISLVMNPATPLEVVARLVGLLLRPELVMAARSPGVAAQVRALCIEHLVRRPPGDEAPPSKPELQ